MPSSLSHIDDTFFAHPHAHTHTHTHTHLQMEAFSENTLHQTQTICNTLWGHQLSFHAFTVGDSHVNFASLWPDKKSLVEIYRNANLERASYELCKLLLATKSVSSLRALLAEKVLLVNDFFHNGGVTLAHLACALGCKEAVQLLKEYSVGSNPWIAKDDKGIGRVPVVNLLLAERYNCILYIRVFDRGEGRRCQSSTIPGVFLISVIPKVL